jgi:Na+/serine symporter
LPKKNIQKLVIYLLIGELIPFTIACYLVITLADVFVPIMGRSGSDMNPNIYFGLIVSSIIAIFGFSGLTSVFVSFKKRLLVTALLFSVLIINPLVVFGFIGKIPYQEKTPMRINVVVS